jgi:hypothetical protein
MPRKPKNTQPAIPSAATSPAAPPITKTAAIAAALQAHPDKMPMEIAKIMKAEGWDVNSQAIRVVKSKLKDRQQRANQKPRSKAAPVELAKPDPTTTWAEDDVSFDSLIKAKRMAEQLGGIQQARAAIAALAELVD